MRHPSQWLSTKPDIDDETGRPTRWWHWSREWESDYDDYRWRVILGDIAVEGESASGEPGGMALTFDVRLWEDTGQFDQVRMTGRNGQEYHDHSITICVLRWGLYLAWRGGRK